MTIWVLIMHLVMADGSVVTRSEDFTGTIEACLDYGKKRINEHHLELPDSTSGLHFCIKKEDA